MTHPSTITTLLRVFCTRKPSADDDSTSKVTGQLEVLRGKVFTDPASFHRGRFSSPIFSYMTLSTLVIPVNIYSKRRVECAMFALDSRLRRTMVYRSFRNAAMYQLQRASVYDEGMVGYAAQIGSSLVTQINGGRDSSAARTHVVWYSTSLCMS